MTELELEAELAEAEAESDRLLRRTWAVNAYYQAEYERAREEYEHVIAEIQARQAAAWELPDNKALWELACAADERRVQARQALRRSRSA